MLIPRARARPAKSAASATVVTIGAITHGSAPLRRAASAMASSWVSSTSDLTRETRSPRMPSAGLVSSARPEERQRLVRTGVEGADDDVTAGGGLEDRGVGGHLLLVVRRVTPVQEEELGAEQPHALGVRPRRLEVGRRADVAAAA